MGAGTSSGKSLLSEQKKAQITKGIQTHDSAATDNAIKNLKGYIAKEQNIIGNYDSYKKSGYITGKNDSWWKHHVDSLKGLKAQLDYFEKERKRLGK